LIPLSSSVETLPEKTSFCVDEKEALKDIFVSIRKEYPSLMVNRDNFLLTIQTLYDEINATTLKAV
jgi:hypothetical protein